MRNAPGERSPARVPAAALLPDAAIHAAAVGDIVRPHMMHEPPTLDVPVSDPQEEMVILVDAADRETGVGSKLDVHRQGLLHRAFSVIIWDDEGRQLLQKRAASKYHSGGLWTNACCGHPRPSEDVKAAAARRLREEMGFETPLEWLGTILYRAALDNGLSEHELVHIFHGRYGGHVAPDPREAEDFRWAGLDDIRRDVTRAPSRYSVWFSRYVAEEWPMATRPPAQSQG